MTSFILNARALDVKKFKSEAKIDARNNGKTHLAALDEQARQEAGQYQNWAEYQRFETAELLPNSRIRTRLRNGIALEFRLKGFAPDLSDFVVSASVTVWLSSYEEDDAGELWLVYTVEKVVGALEAWIPRINLNSLFDEAKDTSPLRERLAPLCMKLKPEAEAAQDAWKKLTSQRIRLSGLTYDREGQIWDIEAMIASLIQGNKHEKALVLAKAAIATYNLVPKAWLLLLETGKYERKEFLRLIDCALAACEWVYGRDFNIVPQDHPHFVAAMDTYVTIKQREAAAQKDILGDPKGAKLVEDIVIGQLTSGKVPQHLLMQSQTLRPL